MRTTLIIRLMVTLFLLGIGIFDIYMKQNIWLIAFMFCMAGVTLGALISQIIFDRIVDGVLKNYKDEVMKK